MEGRLPSAQSARAALRRATNAAHERLHGAPQFTAIANGTLGLSGYTDLLGTLAGLYGTVGPALGLDRERLALLDADLAWAGAPGASKLPWPSPENPAARLGWQYVIEGSIFGGRIIHRQLDYLLGDGLDGRRFFAGTVGAAGRWHALCVRFEETGRDEPALTRMIGGSRDAFAWFDHHLMPEPVHG